MWTREGPMGNESGKIKWEIVKWTRGRGLDLGCGYMKTYPHFIGVDNRKDAILFNQQINCDVVVQSAADLPMFASGSMDFVFSSHLLEHFPLDPIDPRKWTTPMEEALASKMLIEKFTAAQALKEWMRVLRRDGNLVLYVPDEDQYPKVGVDGANPDHCFDCSYESILGLMKKTGCQFDLVEFQKRGTPEDNEYSLLFVFKKIGNGQHESWRKYIRPEKMAGVVRYGAYGDLLQCSSVFAGLKKQGYHVTLFTSPPGHEVILHDRNLDDFYLQDKDQVPNHLLGEYWAYHAKKYDRWVNLSESIECSLLSVPGRTPYTWSPAARHAYMNLNYLEHQHRLAQVPHEPAVRFFALDSEREWAAKQRRAMGGHPLILWALSGSSIHKTWGGLDRTIAAILLDFPDSRIVLVGGPDAKILEQGWEKEPRVICRSGVWKIRETMAFLEQADVMIGPETGVMNAAACTEQPKIVFLSHSTHENLTRDWVNTWAVFSENTSCPGRGENQAPACHQMHYNWEYCKQWKGEDEHGGTAQCQRDINGEAAYGAIHEAISSTLKVTVAKSA